MVGPAHAGAAVRSSACCWSIRRPSPSITSERDRGAIDLLLVTDLTAKEFIFGKLGGIFYNVKEMILRADRCCAAICGTSGR